MRRRRGGEGSLRDVREAKPVPVPGTATVREKTQGSAACFYRT